MTAILSHTFADRAEVLVDSALWNKQTGAVIGFSPKAIPIGDKPLVITGRGGTTALGALAYNCAQIAATCSTVDETVLRFGDWLEAQDRSMFEPGADVLVAGWSESRGAFHSHAYLDLDRVLMPITSDFHAGVPLDQTDFNRGGFSFKALEKDFRGEGLRMIKAARAKPVHVGGQSWTVVGGSVLLFTITAAGVKHETLGAWFDMCGLPIDPTAPWMDAPTAVRAAA